MALAPRAVVVHRRTEFDELVDRHGTAQQAAFYLRSRDRSMDEVRARHEAIATALTAVANAVPAHWRQGLVERHDLDRFTFDPEDVVIAVGQDGLVANVAKYLDGQPVVGVDPEPGRNPGILVRFQADATAAVLARVERGAASTEDHTMVRADTDDGQHLEALNEIFLGHPSHQSARYRIEVGGRHELQSSSGILCGTGTGASGWLRSAWLERGSPGHLPGPTDPGLAWFVREAWPSPVTLTTCTAGLLDPEADLRVTSQHDDLVLFGDGMETDALHLRWGQRAVLRAADRRLRLVVA